MNKNKNLVLLGFCALVLNGCAAMFHSCDDASEVRVFRTPTEFMVNSGIRNYEEGNYSVSVDTLQNLVENRAATKSEKSLAYKYLAFSHCINPDEVKEQREKLCRDSFKKAFELNPNFKLTPAEAGHPVWGPIFSSVKLKMSK